MITVDLEELKSNNQNRNDDWGERKKRRRKKWGYDFLAKYWAQTRPYLTCSRGFGFLFRRFSLSKSVRPQRREAKGEQSSSSIQTKESVPSSLTKNKI